MNRSEWTGTDWAEYEEYANRSESGHGVWTDAPEEPPLMLDKVLRPTRESGGGVWVDSEGRALRLAPEWPYLSIMCDTHPNGKRKRLFRVVRVDLSGPFSDAAEAWWRGLFGALPPAELAEACGARLWHVAGAPCGANWRRTSEVEGVDISDDARAGYNSGFLVGYQYVQALNEDYDTVPATQAIMSGERYRNTWVRGSFGTSDAEAADTAALAKGLAVALFVPEAMGRYWDDSAIFNTRADGALLAKPAWDWRNVPLGKYAYCCGKCDNQGLIDFTDARTAAVLDSAAAAGRRRVTVAQLPRYSPPRHTSGHVI